MNINDTIDKAMLEKNYKPVGKLTGFTGGLWELYAYFPIAKRDRNRYLMRQIDENTFEVFVKYRV